MALFRKSPRVRDRNAITEPKSEARDLRRTAQERHPDRCRDRLPAARLAARGVAGPDRTQQDRAAPAGDRPEFGDHERAQLLRDQRGRAHHRQSERYDQGDSQLRIHPRRDPDPGDIVAGARAGDRGAAGKHHLPFRLGLPVPEPRPAPARQVREGRARIASQRSRAEDRRHRDLAVQRQGPADCSGDDGPGLRQLPQQPPREPEEGLEGW
ncbi:hypothetical protein ACVWZV_002711 [Bradyrhizobium sp. GM5.1]